MNTVGLQLKQLVQLLKKAKVDYALLGGLAVAVYGEPRMSFDIDINILLKQDRINDFLKLARKFGFSPIPANIKKFAASTGVIPMKFSKNNVFGRCDFIIAQNDLEYLGIKRAILRNIYSQKAKIITCEDLILHKIISERPRDLEDLQGILIHQRDKIDLQYIELWLKKIDRIGNKHITLSLFRKLINSS